MSVSSLPANILQNCYFAGAAAGSAAGAAGAAAGAAGAAGASTLGASAVGASSLLQPNTAIDKEAMKIMLTKIANTFLIDTYPPFTDFTFTGFITQLLMAHSTLFF
jgi:hypothetical protein